MLLVYHLFPDFKGFLKKLMNSLNIPQNGFLCIYQLPPRHLVKGILVFRGSIG